MMSLFFLVGFHLASKKVPGKDVEIVQIMEMIFLLILSSFRIVEIARRVPYVLAFLSPIQLNVLKKGIGNKMRKAVFVGVWSIIIVMQIFAVGKLTRFEINGLNYIEIFEFFGMNISK